MPVAVSLDSRLGRIVRRVSGSRTFMRIGPHVVPHLDRLLHRVSGGRLLLSQGMLPSLVLMTVGAKTGQPRTTPLATMRDGAAFYVVGSNFGRDKHPGWTANLMKSPDVEISYRGRRIPVHAHLLDADERAALWDRLVAYWPNYDVYTARSGRELRIFRLQP